MKEFTYSTIYLILFVLSAITCQGMSSSNNTTSKKDKCYVLALEGGGDKGAYQSGVLKGLVDSIPSEDIQWDVITGVSVGSIDAIAIATYDLGKESEATDFLIETWRDIKGKGDIYQNWWGGYIQGLLLETGLYNTAPLKSKLESIIQNRELKRRFICGATNYMTGEFKTFDEINLQKHEYVDAVASSASYPVVFPLMNFRGNVYMDGGVRINIDISSGINKCLDMGYDDEAIVVDVVMLSSSILPNPPKKTHPIGVLSRYIEISGFDKTMGDFEYTTMSFPHVNFRYVVAPTKKLPSGAIPLTFSPEEIEEMIDMGMKDAKDVVNEGARINLDRLLRNFHDQRNFSLGRRERRPIFIDLGKEAKEFKKENLGFLDY